VHRCLLCLVETTIPSAKLIWQNIGRVWLLQVLTATVAEFVPARPDHHATLHVTTALVKIGSIMFSFAWPHRYM
jgi:hypothetical protein